MTPRWLQPAIWSVTALVIAAASVGHCVIWITYITDDSTAVEDFLMEDMELTMLPLNSSDQVTSTAGVGVGSPTSMPTSDVTNHAHIGINMMPPHHRAQELEYWHHHHAADYAVEGEMKLYSIRAPSQLIVTYLVYYLPLLIVGIAGWMSQHWPATTPRVWMSNSWLVAFFSRSTKPVAFLEHCFGGLAKAELLFLIFFFAPKAAHLAWFVGVTRDQWRVGMDSLYMLTGITETQYWVERLGKWFSSDFQIMAPFLFALTAQGSLAHSYLGVSYGTMRKWHRWLGSWILFDVLLHGLLYQVLLVSDETSLWARLHSQLAYHHGVSILAGFISWVGAIAMLAGIVPLALIKSSGWKWVWERVHIAAAVVVVVFGVVHSRKVWVCLAPGLVLYGIDVAHRWLQASHTATATMSLSTFSKVLSAVVPLKEGTRHPYGGHVWLSVPALRGSTKYRAFAVASSSTDPRWHNSMLLQCKCDDPWAHEIVQGLQAGKHQKAAVRIQGPFGGHEMSRVELHSTRKLVVFSGGFGITSVLPMLQRLALHRLRWLSEAALTCLSGADDTPQVKVFHSARSMDELILIAPLLEHPGIFDIQLHFTGNPHDLRQPPHLHTLPPPAQPTNTTPSNTHAHAVFPPSVTVAISGASGAARGVTSAASHTSIRSVVVETAPLAQASQSAQAISSSTQNAERSLTSLASAPATLQSTTHLPPQNDSTELLGLSLVPGATPTARVPVALQPAPIGEATESNAGRAVRSAEPGAHGQIKGNMTGDRMLIGLNGKWASLCVWIGAWVASFALLLLGELWYNGSAAAQAGQLHGDDRDDRRFKMAAYNLLALALTTPTIPLLLHLLFYFPVLCWPPRTRSPAPAQKPHGRGRGLRIGSSDSSGRWSRWSRSSSSGAVLPVTAPHHPSMQSHEGAPIAIKPRIPAHKLLPSVLSSAHAQDTTGHTGKGSSSLFYNTHSLQQLAKYGLQCTASDGALKHPPFMHSMQSAPVIVMHQRTQHSTQTTSQEASILSTHSMPRHGSMRASVGHSIVVPAGRTDSLGDTHFTSQMLSADIYAMVKSMRQSGAMSDSSHSGSFSRVFSPPRHMFNAWLQELSAAGFFPILEQRDPQDARAEWLEAAVQLAPESAVAESSAMQLHAPAATPEARTPPASLPPRPQSPLAADPSSSAAAAQARARQTVYCRKPPTGRKQPHPAPGYGSKGLCGGYSVGTWVSSINNAGAQASMPRSASPDGNEATMNSMLLTAPSTTAAASRAHTNLTQTHSTSAEKTPLDTVSNQSSDRSAHQSRGDRAASGLPVSTAALQPQAPLPSGVLSNAMEVLRAAHVQMDDPGIHGRFPGEVPGSSQGSSEKQPALLGVHATHVSHASSQGTASESHGDPAALPTMQLHAASATSAQMLCETLSAARSMQASLHHTPIGSSAASDSGLAATAPLEAPLVGGPLAPPGLATHLVDEPTSFAPSALPGNLQSFAVEGLADATLSSSLADGSTEDGISFLPQPEAEVPARALHPTAALEAWGPATQVAAPSSLSAALDVALGPHGVPVGANEGHSSSVLSFKSAPQASEDLDHLDQSGAATSGAATSGGAAKELRSPEDPPEEALEEEAAQALQTVQTATGTVTRMHARAPKTWSQSLRPEASQTGKLQAAQGMDLELLQGPAQRPEGGHSLLGRHTPGSEEEEAFLPGWPQQAQPHLPDSLNEAGTDAHSAAYSGPAPASEEEEGKSYSQNPEAAPIESSSGSGAIHGSHSRSKGVAGPLSPQHRTRSQSQSTECNPLSATHALPPHEAASHSLSHALSTAATDSLSSLQPPVQPQSQLGHSNESLSLALSPTQLGSSSLLSTGGAHTLPGTTRGASSEVASAAGFITHVLRAFPPVSPRSADLERGILGTGDGSVSLVLTPTLGDRRPSAETGSQSIGGIAGPLPHMHDSSDSNIGTSTVTVGSITHALVCATCPLAAGESSTVSLKLPHNTAATSGFQVLGPIDSITHAIHACPAARQGDGASSMSVSLGLSGNTGQSAGSQSSAVAKLLPTVDTGKMQGILESTSEEEAGGEDASPAGSVAGKGAEHTDSSKDLQQGTVVPVEECSEASNEGRSASLALPPGTAHLPPSGIPSTPQLATSEGHSQYINTDQTSPSYLPRGIFRHKAPGPISESLNKHWRAARARGGQQPVGRCSRAGAVCEGMYANHPVAPSVGSGPISDSANTLINLPPSPSNTHTPSAAERTTQQTISSNPSQRFATHFPALSQSMRSSSGSKRSAVAAAAVRRTTRDATVATSEQDSVSSSRSLDVDNAGMHGSPPPHYGGSAGAGSTQNVGGPVTTAAALGHWMWTSSGALHSSQHGTSVAMSELGPPPSEAYMPSGDSDLEGSVGTTGTAAARTNASRSEQSSDAPSLLSLTLPPMPSLPQTSVHTGPHASPEPSLHFSSGLNPGPTPRAIGAASTEGHMHALHAFGTARLGTTFEQGAAGCTQRPANPTPTWSAVQPSLLPQSAHSGTAGSLSPSSYATQTDADATAELRADSASKEMAPLPAPHLSYDGSDQVRATEGSWGSATRLLDAETGSGTLQLPSGPASFETRESEEPATSIQHSSAGSDTLSALDRAVDHRLSQVHSFARGDQTATVCDAPEVEAEVHTAPMWAPSEPPVRPNPRCSVPTLTGAPKAKSSASGSMHGEEAGRATGSSATAAEAHTKQSSGSPSHYDSVLGFQTGASSVRIGDASVGLLVSGTPAAADDNPVQSTAMQLLTTPLATADSAISTDRSSVHHPMDYFHGKKKEKEKARREALQARAVSQEAGEEGLQDFLRQESSTTDHGCSDAVARFASLRSQPHGGSTQMTSPAVTDSVESVGLAAALDLKKEPGQHAQVKEGTREVWQGKEYTVAHCVRQTVSPGGIVIIHDYEDETDEDDAEPPEATADAVLERETEIMRVSVKLVKSIDMVPDEGRGGEESSGGASGRIQIVVDCSAADRVFIRSTKAGSRPVEVQLGRVDVAATVHAAFEEANMREPVNIWAAGSSSLNLAVQMATSALPLRTNVHVLTTTYRA